MAAKEIKFGADGADLGDFFPARNRLGQRTQLVDRCGHGFFNTAPHGHRVAAGGNVARALAEDGSRQDRGRRGAVARLVVGAARDLADHLGAHIFELVLELDFFRDGHAVLGDARCPETLVEHDVAPLGAQGDLHGIRQ